MITALIVDDEAASRNGLAKLLSEFVPEVKVLGKADSVFSAAEQIKALNPDIVFLDVEMPGKDGFDLISESAPSDFEVIFTTAHEQYAIKAIKASAIDYLLKPINPNELIEAVRKVQEKKEPGNKKLETFISHVSDKKRDPQIAISTMEGLIFMKLANIIYCRGDGAYTFFFLKNGEKVVASKNLKEFEDILCEHGFFRTHKSYIIQLAEMKRYVKGDGGHVIMSNGETVDVSKRRKEGFIDALASL
jgi:two-component system LytT family response regulator